MRSPGNRSCLMKLESLRLLLVSNSVSARWVYGFSGLDVRMDFGGWLGMDSDADVVACVEFREWGMLDRD